MDILEDRAGGAAMPTLQGGAGAQALPHQSETASGAALPAEDQARIEWATAPGEVHVRNLTRPKIT
jgi:hypothetical protein